jgi:prepilin-type processing-associated H-X9-DG protein
MAAVADGLSQTTLLSEVMRSTVDGTFTWDRPILDHTSVVDTTLAFNYADGRSDPGCDGNGSTAITFTGLAYCVMTIQTSLYSHTLPPNWNRCASSGPQRYNCYRPTPRRNTETHLAASSYHPGGVMVCLADGSVHFIRDAINFPTWQALGSRAGGEVVGDY